MKVIAISTFVFVSSLVAVGCQPMTEVGGPSENDGRVSAQVQVPCAGAELHGVHTYSACNAGHVDQREKEDWCCPDGTMPETDSLLSATSETCGAETAATTCTNHDIQILEDCSNEMRTDAARKCDNAGCHYTISYDRNGKSCTVACVD